MNLSERAPILRAGAKSKVTIPSVLMDLDSIRTLGRELSRTRRCCPCSLGESTDPMDLDSVNPAAVINSKSQPLRYADGIIK